MDVDASGAAYMTGSTFSWDFPTLNGFQSANRGQTDTFVVKLTPNGGLVYSTLLGGLLEEYATAIDVDGFGRAHITGSTASADFPTVSALQTSLGGAPVFRTTNGGDTWVGLSAGLRASGILTFAIDSAAPQTVYAGTYLEGVFKSSDAGATWLAAGACSRAGQVSALP